MESISGHLPEPEEVEDGVGLAGCSTYSMVGFKGGGNWYTIEGNSVAEVSEATEIGLAWSKLSFKSLILDSSSSLFLPLK